MNLKGRVAARLVELGLTLPPVFQPVANYVGHRLQGPHLQGQHLWIAGMGPTWAQAVHHAGKLGGTVSLEDGIKAARLTALNMLAQAAEALDGDLDRIAGCLKVFVLVNARPDFIDAHRVADGVTDQLVEVLGDIGRPVRSAIAAPSLPLDISTEADALFLLHS